MVLKRYKFILRIESKAGVWDRCGDKYAIVYNGCSIGYAGADRAEVWRVQLRVVANQADLLRNPNCPWALRTVKASFRSKTEVSTWLNDPLVTRELLARGDLYEIPWEKPNK